MHAIRNGVDIVTETQMAMMGINKPTLARGGGQVDCFMSDEEVAEEAREKFVTRVNICMEKLQN